MATTIARNTWIDDDGSGLTGTPINNARLQGDVYDPVDALFAAPGGLGIAGPLTERGRPAPLGDPIAIPYAAANFTASGSMIWTVTAGQQSLLAYTLIGRLAIIAFAITGSTLGGTASTDVYIAMPFSPVFGSMICSGGRGLVGGLWIPMIAYMSGNRLAISLLTGGAFSVGSFNLQGTALMFIP